MEVILLTAEDLFDMGDKFVLRPLPQALFPVMLLWLLVLVLTAIGLRRLRTAASYLLRHTPSNSLLVVLLL